MEVIDALRVASVPAPIILITACASVQTPTGRELEWTRN
jgi:hypothetical protein